MPRSPKFFEVSESFLWEREANGCEVVSGTGIPDAAPLGTHIPVSNEWTPAGIRRRGSRPRPQQGRFVVPMGRGEPRPYRLFREHPSAWKDFVQTPETDAGIATFATEFGLLGAPRICEVSTSDGRLRLGEPVADWLLAIRTMKIAHEAAKRTGSAKRAGQRDSQRSLIAMAGLDQLKRYMGLFLDAPPDATPRGDVQFLVNTYLTSVPAHLDWRDGGFEWSVKPTSLLGALWFQFARSLAPSRRLRKCRYRPCGQLFTPIRTDTFFCGTKCRVYWHRQHPARRKRSARSQ